MLPGSRSHRALTLVELLVVVLLLGVAASVVGVSWRGSTDAARLRAATIELEQAVRTVSRHARLHRQPATLALALGTGRYRLEWSTAADPGWRTLRGVTLESPDSAAPPAGAVQRIRIGAAGAALPWKIALRAGQQRRVVVSDGIRARLSTMDSP